MVNVEELFTNVVLILVAFLNSLVAWIPNLLNGLFGE